METHLETQHDDLEPRMREFRRAFNRAGAKITHQRIEVFREVARTREHPDAVTVYERVRKRLPTISLDTVYRTLWTLMDMGLISTLGVHHERVRFDGNTDTHHHFICTRCGKARDIHSDDLNNLRTPESVKRLGSIETTHVEFRGLCSECLKEGPGRSKK